MGHIQSTQLDRYLLPPRTVADSRETVPDKTDTTPVLFDSQIITKARRQKENVLGEDIARELRAQWSGIASLKDFSVWDVKPE